jgi:hypothetical protein
MQKFPAGVRITTADFVMVEAQTGTPDIHPRFAAYQNLRSDAPRRPGISNLSAHRTGNISRVQYDQRVVQPRLLPAGY